MTILQNNINLFFQNDLLTLLLTVIWFFSISLILSNLFNKKQGEADMVDEEGRIIVSGAESIKVVLDIIKEVEEQKKLQGEENKENLEKKEEEIEELKKENENQIKEMEELEEEMRKSKEKKTETLYQ